MGTLTRPRRDGIVCHYENETQFHINSGAA